MQHEKNELPVGSTMVFLGSTVQGITLTATLFSTSFGTTGGFYFGFIILGWIVQLFYVQMRFAVTGQMDFVSMEAVVIVSIVWLLIHWGFRRVYQSRGFVTHSYDPGRGIFHFMFPAGTRGVTIGLVSDISVSLLLGLLCSGLGSPALARWYFLVCPMWIVAMQCYIAGRDRWQVQSMHDAKAEAQYYASKSQRRF